MICFDVLEVESFGRRCVAIDERRRHLYGDDPRAVCAAMAEAARAMVEAVARGAGFGLVLAWASVLAVAIDEPISSLCLRAADTAQCMHARAETPWRPHDVAMVVAEAMTRGDVDGIAIGLEAVIAEAIASRRDDLAMGLAVELSEGVASLALESGRMSCAAMGAAQRWMQETAR